MADTYIQFTDDLRAAIAWLNETGLRGDAGRFGKNLRFLETLVEARKKQRTDELAGREQELISAIPEVSELIYMHKRFASMPPGDLKARLEKVLKGPVSEAEEGENIIGRNTSFELIIGCELDYGGLSPTFSGPGDLAVQTVNHRINIECKRLQSRNALRRRIKDAASQLAMRASEHPGTRNIGVIALSIGKLFTEGTKALIASSRAEAKGLIAADVARFVAEAEREMKASINENVHAVLYYLRAVAKLQDGGLLWARQIGFNIVDRGDDSPAELVPMMNALLKIRDEGDGVLVGPASAHSQCPHD